jgi:hypothetical protein
MTKFIAGMLVIGVIWFAGTQIGFGSLNADIPVAVTHGDEVLDFGLREMK